MKTDLINFNAIRTLIVDSDTYSADIIQQILRGFGAQNQLVANTGADAMRLLETSSVELVLCEANLSDMRGSELIRWVRRNKAPTTRYLPIIALSGYTQTSGVNELRDAGANIVVKKPSSPQVLLGHIVWAANTPRPFIDSAGYCGPDRRFKAEGFPDGVGRRSTDLNGAVGEATEPNLSQDEIDSVFKPMRSLG